MTAPAPVRLAGPGPESSSTLAGTAGDAAAITGAPARRSGLTFGALALVLLVLVAVSAGSGQMNIPVTEVAGSVLRRLGLPWGPAPAADHAEAALYLVRFPRVMLTVLVGAALAIGGVLMQGIFGNPLAEPGVVGVSAGAAAGACLVIVTGFSGLGEWSVVAAAFGGGLLATWLVYTTARQSGRTEVVTLILTGVAVNAVGGALIAFFTFIGDASAREEIVFWQLGSFNGTRWQHVAVVAPIVLVGCALAWSLARRLDLLALGERPARHLGVEVERLRGVAIVIVALLTSAAVAFTGIIAFVGLVVPHLLRMVLGPGHRLLLPAAILGGAVLLSAADLGARTLVSFADLPIGMLTALIGGPFFFYLIRRTRRGAGGWS
ncbi:iron complex transport system permease protein [Bogoriella caseilytica]|uniref:Iron complex transport system permease protein n=1 Tax=Bogoriella caseilytica TaxID=56055 RepID=A0A3N2BAK0_9MICO|nr:iron complex transport system permease protein [Bogoriella caseilytica]